MKTKSRIAYAIAILGLTVLAPGLSQADDLDDAQHSLDRARVNRAQAEANRARAEADLKAAEVNDAVHEARAARKAADEAEFARFETELSTSEAARVARSDVNRSRTTYRYSTGPDGTRYVERKESRSNPGYVEGYEVQERTTINY